jgi:uncharacterized protein YndB with AHSA1/START domain
MDGAFTAHSSITINATPARVWEALTTPSIIKLYFFGTDVITDWKVGGPLIYRGEWQGKHYEDKGTILKFEPEQLLVTTHWSPLSGAPESPENSHVVSYELDPADGKTRITITQTNNKSEKEAAHSAENWTMILEGLKQLLEGASQ